MEKNQQMDRLFIVMPAYNEAANIETTVKKWLPLLRLGSADSRLVVFNDGSKDDTLARCHKLAARSDQFIVVNKPNSGHGPTCRDACAYALDHGADYIFQTDSDDQTEPEEMKELWTSRQEFDIQIGLRKHRQDGFTRVVVSRILKLVLLLIFGISVRDANTPFRLMSKDALRSYLEVIPPGFFLVNALMSTVAVYMGDRVGWKEITFKPRRAGVNSINLKRVFRIGWKALKELSAVKKDIAAKYGTKAGDKARS